MLKNKDKSTLSLSLDQSYVEKLKQEIKSNKIKCSVNFETKLGEIQQELQLYRQRKQEEKCICIPKLKITQNPIENDRKISETSTLSIGNTSKAPNENIQHDEKLFEKRLTDLSTKIDSISETISLKFNDKFIAEIIEKLNVQKEEKQKENPESIVLDKDKGNLLLQNNHNMLNKMEKGTGELPKVKLLDHNHEVSNNGLTSDKEILIQEEKPAEKIKKIDQSTETTELNNQPIKTNPLSGKLRSKKSLEALKVQQMPIINIRSALVLQKTLALSIDPNESQISAENFMNIGYITEVHHSPIELQKENSTLNNLQCISNGKKTGQVLKTTENPEKSASNHLPQKNKTEEPFLTSITSENTICTKGMKEIPEIFKGKPIVKIDLQSEPSNSSIDQQFSDKSHKDTSLLKHISQSTNRKVSFETSSSTNTNSSLDFKLSTTNNGNKSTVSSSTLKESIKIEKSFSLSTNSKEKNTVPVFKSKSNDGLYRPKITRNKTYNVESNDVPVENPAPLTQNNNLPSFGENNTSQDFSSDFPADEEHLENRLLRNEQENKSCQTSYKTAGHYLSVNNSLECDLVPIAKMRISQQDELMENSTTADLIQDSVSNGEISWCQCPSISSGELHVCKYKRSNVPVGNSRKINHQRLNYNYFVSNYL